MTKTKKFSAVSIVLLIVAVIMLLIGGVGGARAALTESDTHNATLEMKDISVVLQENGDDVEDEGELLASLLGKDETLKVGKKYDEVLTVKNDGNIDEYVRVILYKYWTDGEGKAVDLDPELIKLGLGANWKVDDKASTKERTVLYYTKPLEKGKTTEAALESITIDGKLATMVTQTKETVTEGETTYTTVTNEYTYNGLQFGLKAEVDAVQTHNAEDAIKSAWGKEMSEVIG